MPRKKNTNFVTNNDYKSDGYRPIHPALYNIGIKYPELSYKTFKNKPYAFVYDNRSPERCMKAIARIDKHNGWSTVVINNERRYTGTIQNCLGFIHTLLLDGVVKGA